MTGEARARDRFLPADIPSDRLVACIGLMGDTHMPERYAALPPALFEALRGVDLLFHTGDVGELWVLDRLSAIAPAIAVHGNDESEQARLGLPYQQIVTVAGRRLLLTHGHYPDRADEIASRRDDAWAPKLARRAELARAAGAAIAVFGHTHIPMLVEHEGVLLINPGAIASSSGATRQRTQTVALLFVRDDGLLAVTHIDLAAPQEPFIPRIDLAAGFRAAHDRFSESILSPELAATFDYLRTQPWWNMPEQGRPLWTAWYRAAHRAWRGEVAVLTPADVLAEARADATIPPDARARFETALSR